MGATVKRLNNQKFIFPFHVRHTLFSLFLMTHFELTEQMILSAIFVDFDYV